MDISIMKIGRRLIPHRKGKWLSNLFNECRGGASTGGGLCSLLKIFKINISVKNFRHFYDNYTIILVSQFS
jgi:hypothetical protein